MLLRVWISSILSYAFQLVISIVVTHASIENTSLAFKVILSWKPGTSKAVWNHKHNLHQYGYQRYHAKEHTAFIHIWITKTLGKIYHDYELAKQLDWWGLSCFRYRFRHNKHSHCDVTIEAQWDHDLDIVMFSRYFNTHLRVRTWCTLKLVSIIKPFLYCCEGSVQTFTEHSHWLQSSIN